jgi:hypothetical protein
MPSKSQGKERDGEGRVDEEVERHKILRGEKTREGEALGRGLCYEQGKEVEKALCSFRSELQF